MIFVDATDELNDETVLDHGGVDTIRETLDAREKYIHTETSTTQSATAVVRRTTANSAAMPHKRSTDIPTPLIKFEGFSPISTPAPPDFEVGESLGAGGMGSVYTATQAAMGRLVAVKRSHDPAGQGATYQSVHKEGLLFGRLDHPNIPPVHMVGQDREGHAVLVMKLIEGTDLRSMVTNRKHPRWSAVDGRPEMWMLDVFMQVTHAVEHAHSKRVLHRDIKTENIMVGDFGQVFLIDWGIAVDMNDTDALTTTGKFVGTPCFAAPEMVHEGTRLDERTDVYLLGAMLLEMVSGGVLFKGRNLQEILDRVRTGDREEIPASLPNALASIIHKAIAPDPNDRFASAGEFRSAVHQYRRDRHHYQNIARAEEHLETLETWLAGGQNDVSTGYRFMTLAHESLALLKSALRANVAIDLTRRLLSRNVQIQTEYSIMTEQLGVANALVAELQRESGPDDALVVELKRKIAVQADAITRRETELQIQTNQKMLEKMHRLEAQLVSQRDQSAGPSSVEEDR